MAESIQSVEIGADGKVVSSTTELVPDETKSTPQAEEINRMRQASGEVSDSRRLVKFLYLLARDHMTIGQIESLLDESCFGHGGSVVYTNGWLAEWAKDAADRLE